MLEDNDDDDGSKEDELGNDDDPHDARMDDNRNRHVIFFINTLFSGNTSPVNALRKVTLGCEIQNHQRKDGNHVTS